MWNIDPYSPIRGALVIAAFLGALAVGALICWGAGFALSFQSAGTIVGGALVAAYAAGKSLDWACDA